MRSHFQFVITPTADTQGTSLVLHYDDRRYLFGAVAEGTQRAFVQEPGRHFRTQILFLTGRTEWQTTGGLIGHMLSLADVIGARAADATSRNAKIQHDPRLTLFGARNLCHTLATARTFVLRRKMPVDVHEIHPGRPANESTYRDENIEVWALTASPPAVSPAPTGAKSPLKRSFDDTRNLGCEMSVRDVVAGMFGSDWPLDKLEEVPLRSISGVSAFVRSNDNESRKYRYTEYTGPMGPGENVPDIKVFIRRPRPSSLVKSIPSTSPNPESVSYIVRSREQRGRFDVAKALKLGLHDKSKYRLITRGESLVNDKGDTITPDMVLGPNRPGQCAAILHIPTADYLGPLIDGLELRADLLKGLGVVVWILGEGVVKLPQLRDYMARHPEVHHIVTAPDVNANRLSFDSAAASSMRLHAVDPARYPPLVYDNTTPTDIDLPRNAQVGARGMIVNFDPTVSITAEPRQAMTSDLALSVLQRETLELADRARAEITHTRPRLDAWAEGVDRKDTEIIPLGTGSALPSKYRNVSATLVRVPGWGSLLLDCGENTIGQLRRMYRPPELRELFRDLRLIWISHMHADHHLGTASVIKAWYSAVHGSIPAPPDDAVAKTRTVGLPGVLSIVADRPMLQWLYEYSCVEDYGYSRVAPLWPERRADSDETRLCWFSAPEHDHSPTRFDSRYILTPSALALRDLQVCSVAHCKGAKALSLTWPLSEPLSPSSSPSPSTTSPGRRLLPLKISYSGDCRPSRDFARIGKDSTLCIHEATFDDELRGDAIAKQHTTTSEALQVATRMGARAVLLTHFSQRYQKLPVLDFASSGVGDGPGQGFDWESTTTAAGTGRWDADPADGEAEDPASTSSMQSGSEAVTTRTTATARNGTPTDSAMADGTEHRARDPTRDDGDEMKVGVAFDHMRIRLGDFAELEKFTPALLELFRLEGGSAVGAGADERSDGDDGDGAGVEPPSVGARSEGIGRSTSGATGQKGATEGDGRLQRQRSRKGRRRD